MVPTGQKSDLPFLVKVQVTEVSFGKDEEASERLPGESLPAIRSKHDAGTFPWQRVLCKKMPDEVMRRLIGRESAGSLAELSKDRSAKDHGYQERVEPEPIELTSIECSILCHLASRPYHAFTKKQLAQAVENWTGERIGEAEVDQHIWTLRDKLGMFHDYVQKVPYMGYRFKE